MTGKMTLTFNPDVYANLLSEVLPQAITTEAENEKALARLESLLQKESLSPEEDRLYDLLLVLVEQFEQANYPLQTHSTPLSRLLHLMESNHLKQTDLLDVFGSSGIVSEVINGKREISKTHAQKLGKRFNVSPALFLV
jgi:HTH-type transcriptional regulator/antitoxin HigA